MSAKTIVVLEQPQQHVREWNLGLSSKSMTASAMLLIDFLALAMLFGFAVLARHLLTPNYRLVSYIEFLPCMVALLFGFALQGLYPGVMLHPADEMRRIFIGVSTIFLLMASATFLYRNAEAYSRSVFLITWAIGSPGILLVRRASRRILCRFSWWGVPAVIFGSGLAAQRVIDSLHNCRRGIRVVGILTEHEMSKHSKWHSVPVLGCISSAPNFAKVKRDLIAIVTVPVKSPTESNHTIQDHCRGFGHVIFIPDIPGLCSLGVSVKEVGGELGLEVPQRLFQQTSSAMKRFLDISLSSLAILLLAPVFVSLALAVKFSSRGKIFFGQKRYGRDGVHFNALKFRTMIPNAEEALADYLDANPEQLLEWTHDRKLRHDPRVTTVGKWLRRMSLDELPQLFNVLTGDMSLIGPRPIVASEIEKYGRAYGLYSRVRPGMTGLWQVSGRNRTTYQERVAFDEFYVNNWSVWLDLYILSRTIQVVITADGAY